VPPAQRHDLQRRLGRIYFRMQRQRGAAQVGGARSAREAAS
jgi:hypothetical protein